MVFESWEGRGKEDDLGEVKIKILLKCSESKR
jgi:hypothetical protein